MQRNDTSTVHLQNHNVQSWLQKVCPKCFQQEQVCQLLQSQGGTQRWSFGEQSGNYQHMFWYPSPRLPLLLLFSSLSNLVNEVDGAKSSSLSFCMVEAPGSWDWVCAHTCESCIHAYTLMRVTRKEMWTHLIQSSSSSAVSFIEKRRIPSTFPPSYEWRESSVISLSVSLVCWQKRNFFIRSFLLSGRETA